MKQKILKSLSCIAICFALYPAMIYLSNPNLYPTYSSSTPSHFKSGFYLVMHTRTQQIPSGLPYEQTASKTYVGPFDSIKTSHSAHMKIKSIHPGIHTHLVKTSTLAP